MAEARGAAATLMVGAHLTHTPLRGTCVQAVRVLSTGIVVLHRALATPR